MYFNCCIYKFVWWQIAEQRTEQKRFYFIDFPCLPLTNGASVSTGLESRQYALIARDFGEVKWQIVILESRMPNQLVFFCWLFYNYKTASHLKITTHVQTLRKACDWYIANAPDSFSQFSCLNALIFLSPLLPQNIWITSSAAADIHSNYTGPRFVWRSIRLGDARRSPFTWYADSAFSASLTLSATTNSSTYEHIHNSLMLYNWSSSARHCRNDEHRQPRRDTLCSVFIYVFVPLTRVVVQIFSPGCRPFWIRFAFSFLPRSSRCFRTDFPILRAVGCFVISHQHRLFVSLCDRGQ